MSEPSILIGMSAWRNVEAGTTAQLWALARSFPHVDFELHTGDALITRARSTVATRFLRDHNEDILFTLDSDIVFLPPDVQAVARQAHELGAIVCGAYATRAWGEGQTAIMLPDEEIVFGTDPTPQLIIYGASGFMAIPRRVLERMVEELPLALMHPDSRRDIQHYRFYEDPEGVAPDGQPISQSEDYNLSHKAAQLGISTYVNPAVRLGHVGPMVFRLEHMVWKQPPTTTLRMRNQRISTIDLPHDLLPFVQGAPVPTGRAERRRQGRAQRKEAVPA